MRNSCLIASLLLSLLVAVICGFAADRSNRAMAVNLVQVTAALQTVTPTLTLPLKSPRIVVHKSERRLELYSGDKLVRTYRVGLGFSPVADKNIEGDGATPEGEFYIFVKNSKSAYYLSLGLSYPNIEDAERGLREKLISKSQYKSIVSSIQQKLAPPQNTRLGGLIYIHGNGAGSDWTLGCVALENTDIKELYDAVEVGTPVTIVH
jgi:murein L,D-transpeptidase YafK